MAEGGYDPTDQTTDETTPLIPKKGMMMMIMMIMISPNTIYMVIQSTQRQQGPLHQAPLPLQPVVSQYL